MAAFNAELRRRRNELYDISKLNLVQWRAGGIDYLVYGNVNLSVFVADYCNGACDFCVARLRYLHAGDAYAKPAIGDAECYLRALRRMLDAVQPLNPSVSLTGGEPTLDPKLPAILKVLAEYGVRKRTLTTNGSGLLRQPVQGGPTVLELLADYRLRHLNISRAHYDESRNVRLMKLKDPTFSNLELAEVVRLAKAAGIRPRLSCILLRDEVGALDEMLNYLEWARGLGVDNVVFRRLMKYDRAAVSPGLVDDFCTAQDVDLLPLWEQMDADPRFTFTTQVLGYYYYVEVFSYKDVDVVSETADLNLMEPEKARSRAALGAPVVYEMVFHPNGNLCGGWREWRDLLLEAT